MNRLKDLTMPALCLAIGIWAAFTYPTQLHTFYEDKIKSHIPVGASAAAAELPTQTTTTPSVTPTTVPVKNNTTEDNRKQVAKASTAGKPMGARATIVRGVAMPTDCTNAQANLITDAEQRGDPTKSNYISPEDIPEYVCGWN